MVPLKYLFHFWRGLEMALINWEINIFPSNFANCFIVTGTAKDHAISDSNLYFPVVSLSNQDNAKLLQ